MKMRMRMRKMSDLISIWQDMKDADALGFRRVKVDHLLGFYLGFDEDRNYSFMVVCADKPPLQSDMRSVKIKVRNRDDGKWSLFLILEEARLFDVFSLLCDDLISSSLQLSSSELSLKTLFIRLAGWRELLEKGDGGLLSESQVRGLAGELTYLKCLMQQIGEIAAVGSWVGPLMADQDFQLDGKAWEVKTIRPGHNSVQIASEKQLDCTVRDIDLVIVQIAGADPSLENTFTLNQLVNEVNDLLSPFFDAKLIFSKALFKAGFLSRTEYDFYHMAIRNISIYEISSNFPCLTSAKLPVGISRASYMLDLSLCAPFKKQSFGG